MQFEIHVRSQHASKGRFSGFFGPDAYVAVTVAPDGAEVPYALNARVLAKRGISIHHFGEGYRLHTGPRSKLGQALAAASRFVAQQQEVAA